MTDGEPRVPDEATSPDTAGDRQRRALEAGRIGTYEIDMRDGSSVGNAIFYEYLGLPADHGRVAFDDWSARIHQLDRERVLGHVGAILRGAHLPDVEYRLVRFDGTTIWVASRTQNELDAEGRHLRAWGVIWDVTVRRSAEAALAAREAELAAVLDQALVGISHRRTDGTLLRMNARFADILGRSVESLATVCWKDIVHHADFEALAERFEAHQRGGDPFIAEARFRRPDGTVVWCRLHVSVTRDSTGAPVSRIAILDDISEQKCAEAEVRRLVGKLDQAARLMTANLMSATLSHELQQPHTAIVNYLAAAAMMVGRAGDPSGVGPTIEGAKDQALRAGRIVQQMRRFVGTGQPALARCNLRRLINEMVDIAPVAAVSSPRIKVNIGPRVGEVEADAIQIQQVLNNLIRNALEASPPGQTITIAARSRGNRVEVSVIDRGPGIPVELRGKIFELFASSKATGLGLGLAISRAIIEAHGGTISADSHAGHTAVTFTLKAWPEPRATAIKDDGVRAARRSSRPSPGA